MPITPKKSNKISSISSDDTSATISNKIISNIDFQNTELMSALETFLKQYKEQQKLMTLPLSVFRSRKLGILEVTVKYLKDNSNLNYSQIAVLLNRDDRTIWTSYRQAQKKSKERLVEENDSIRVDVKIFSDRHLAPLQALVKHLRSRGMTIKQISKELSRDYKTIWLTDKK